MQPIHRYGSIDAAIVYAMRQLTSGGSTLILWQELSHRVNEEIGDKTPLVVSRIKEMFNDDVMVAFPEVMGIAERRDVDDEAAVWEFCQ